MWLLVRLLQADLSMGGGKLRFLSRKINISGLPLRPAELGEVKQLQNAQSQGFVP